MVTPAQTSVAVAGSGVTRAEELPVHSAVLVAGHEMVGGLVSTTVTVLLQLVWRLTWSMAV